MEPEFDSSTEYKTSYTWKNKPHDETADKYEEAVERLMQAQFISFSPNSNKSKQELDPFEMIVRKKMNENIQGEDAYQQQIHNHKSDSGSMKSGSSHSHHHHQHQSQQHQNQQQQYQDRLNNLGSGANSVSSRSSSRSSKSRHSDAGSFQDINDNLSVGSSQDTEIKVVNKPPKSEKTKKKRKEYDASHLNKSRRSIITEEFSGDDLRPIFFRNPDHATEEEKKYLYGPFYVSWPKNKTMPPQFAELQKVYHNNHYY